MTTEELKLNDFEGFDQFLFGDEEHNWRYFLFFVDGANCFCPPITCPKTVAEYQLCHYAYWMTVAEYPWLKAEPPILAINPVQYGNYACEYTDKTGEVCRDCPIIDEKYGGLTCTAPNHPLEKWLKSLENEEMRRDHALECAKIEWKNRINL